MYLADVWDAEENSILGVNHKVDRWILVASIGSYSKWCSGWSVQVVIRNQFEKLSFFWLLVFFISLTLLILFGLPKINLSIIEQFSLHQGNSLSKIRQDIYLLSSCGIPIIKWRTATSPTLYVPEIYFRWWFEAEFTNRDIARALSGSVVLQPPWWPFRFLWWAFEESQTKRYLLQTSAFSPD
jgi:hypothetical protein